MRPDDPELARLLGEYVPVRVVNFKGVDLNRFQFDYDLTFAVLLMNADGYTYSRFGTQDARHSPDLMSVPGLKQAMKDVLAVHRAGAPKGPPDSLPRKTLADLPAFAGTKQAREECYHCHYASNARVTQLQMDGQFRKELLFRFPPPESIGLVLDTDRNNVVKRVIPGTPAERAGVQAGDVVAQAESTPVFTGADLQFALEPVADPGTVRLHLSRGGRRLAPTALQLPRGWRRSDISWRPSQEMVPPSMGFWGKALTEAEKRRHGIPADRLGLQANFMFPGPVWARSRGGLRNGDIVVAVNGQALPDMNIRQFHSHFRLNFNVGDRVRVTVLRGGQQVELQVDCIEYPRE